MLTVAEKSKSDTSYCTIILKNVSKFSMLSFFFVKVLEFDVDVSKKLYLKKNFHIWLKNLSVSKS